MAGRVRVSGYVTKSGRRVSGYSQSRHKGVGRARAGVRSVTGSGRRNVKFSVGGRSSRAVQPVYKKKISRGGARVGARAGSVIKPRRRMNRALVDKGVNHFGDRLTPGLGPQKRKQSGGRKTRKAGNRKGTGLAAGRITDRGKKQAAPKGGNKVPGDMHQALQSLMAEGRKNGFGPGRSGAEVARRNAARGMLDQGKPKAAPKGGNKMPQGSGSAVDKTIRELEDALAAAQKSGNAKKRHEIYHRLQRLKRARGK